MGDAALNDQEKLYWLWLQSCFGYGARIADTLRYFGGAKDLFHAGKNEWRSCGLYGSDLLEPDKGVISRMISRSPGEGETVLRQCEEGGISVITPDMPEYPRRLLALEDLPAVLFVLGDVQSLSAGLPIALVGTRKPSSYGISAAQLIASGLAENGAVIVSGGALGIDSVCHEAALKAGAKTVLVMGGGFYSEYLKENEPLRLAVSRQGALVSEYTPSTRAIPSLFPRRNRIISGLSLGVVIIEAGEKSGTLNTARHAAKQGRDIFAVPGDISSVTYRGSNKLITEGAFAVFGAGDILRHYSFEMRGKRELSGEEPSEPFEKTKEFPDGRPEEKKQKKPARRQRAEKKSGKDGAAEKSAVSGNENEKDDTCVPPADLSGAAAAVLGAIRGGNTSLDGIVLATGMQVHKILTALTELEMNGLVQPVSGGSYRIKG